MATSSFAGGAIHGGTVDPTTNQTTKGNKEIASPLDPSNDRYQAQLKKIQSQSAFGVYIPDVLKAKSGTDYTKDIQLSIRREFWTFSQVNAIVYWALSIGMFIGAVTVSALTPNAFPNIAGEGAMMIWGVFLLTLGLTGIVSEPSARSSMRKCTKDKYKTDDPEGKFTTKDHKVEPMFQGTECLTDWDCTRKSEVTKGVCQAPKLGGVATGFRKGVLPIVTLIGAVITAISFTSTDFRLAKKDLAQSIMYGIGMGNMLVLLFS